jgi:hypothetical protein
VDSAQNDAITFRPSAKVWGALLLAVEIPLLVGNFYLVFSVPRGSAMILPLLGLVLYSILASSVVMNKFLFRWFLIVKRDVLGYRTLNIWRLQRIPFVEIGLSSLISVAVEQSSWQQLLGIGDVIIKYPAPGGGEIRLDNCPDPEALQSLIRRRQAALRSKA